MASNPCLTVLLVYAAIITIALVVTSALLATKRGRSVVCSGDGVGEEVVNTHYSVFDNSHDEVEEKDPEKICQCHCDCKKEELITGVEVFTQTSVGVLVLGLTVYSCLGMRFIILKKRKINAEKLKIENDRITAENERKEKELRKQAFLELIPEMEMSAIAAKPKPVDLE